MPRAASAPAAASSASWLLAPPATARQRRRGAVPAVSTPPSAHGLKTSHGAPIIAAGSMKGTPRSRQRPIAAASTSLNETRAPSASSRSISAPPTLPAPWTRMERPASAAGPKTSSQVTRMAACTPIAVAGPDGPDPPFVSLHPKTSGPAAARIRSMSSDEVPTSGAV